MNKKLILDLKTNKKKLVHCLHFKLDNLSF